MVNKIYFSTEHTANFGRIRYHTRRFRHRPALDRLRFWVRSDGFRREFNPHVTTGVASREYLDKMLTEPFEPFTFSPAGAAVYQLGQFGTASKKLKEWDLNP